MGKIGLLTFHAAHNNGSMLQAVALQNVLMDKFNLDVEIIDFSNHEQKNMYSPIPKPHNWKQVIKMFIWLTNYHQLKMQFTSYENFKRKYMKLSDCSCSTTEELRCIANDYTAYIVGSDQIWNLKCRDADDSYFLNFVTSASKYAYAVSFGANNAFELDYENETHKNYVEDFKFISVREPNAQKWIREATNRDVPVCLDPTMLYDMRQWEDIIDVGDRVIKDDYIFYYCFELTEEVQKFLREVSKKTNLPVYFMDAKEWTLKTCWRNGIRLAKSYGPDIYMNLVKYSTIFITTSFHGTAFATIFRKCFWYIKSQNSESSMDDRATSFLTQLGLTDRYKTMENLKITNLYQEVSYDGIEERIKPLREQSLEYIRLIYKDIIANE